MFSQATLLVKENISVPVLYLKAIIRPDASASEVFFCRIVVPGNNVLRGIRFLYVLD
jgi:hypothetical protein